MGKYFEPALNEEQIAAYLDGMLTEEENEIVESVIDNDEQMQEIMDDMDTVDTAYLGYDQDEDIPLELISDDFALPDVYGYEHDDASDDVYGEDSSDYAYYTDSDTESFDDDNAGDNNQMDYEYT